MTDPLLPPATAATTAVQASAPERPQEATPGTLALLLLTFVVFWVIGKVIGEVLFVWIFLRDRPRRQDP